MTSRPGARLTGDAGMVSPNGSRLHRPVDIPLIARRPGRIKRVVVTKSVTTAQSAPQCLMSLRDC